MSDAVSCAFCLRDTAAARLAGPAVFICGACVAAFTTANER